MVDFNKKITNTNKFRQSALFFKEHGCYTLAPRGTTDYVQFWERETQRCLNGYVAEDGDSITGYHYFYLNYFPIQRLAEEKYVDRNGIERVRRIRKLEFADFYDYDYYYFNAIEEAERGGKHMAVLKARNKGYSFKGASMLVRNYELIPGSQNFAVASEQGFLTNDGLLTKAWDGMDFVDKNTAWSKQRLVDTKLKRTSGYKITDEFGKQTEQGYKSSIIGITLKNNPDRIRGTRGRLILWEEAGKFKDILQAWQIARPAVEEAGVAFGMQIAYGTGGEEADFDGLKEMFYHPDGYNILSFPNIWDEKAEHTRCAFFVPSWTNLSTKDEEGHRIYMDEDGNSLMQKAVQFQIDERNKVKEGASEQVTVDRYIAENCLTPQESILEIGSNIFPKKLLMQQLSRIRTSEKLKNMKHIVDLSWDGNGQVVATEKKTGDITVYPLDKDKKPDGSVVIWEYPVQDPPFGLYIAGCLTPGEKVWTQRGRVNVEEVGLGDKLVSMNGDLVPINTLLRYEKVNEPVYTVTMENTRRRTKFTQEHPLYLSNKQDGEYKFIKVSQAVSGMWTKVPNVYKKEIPVENELFENKDFWWFVGHWVGDGFCTSRGKDKKIYGVFGNDEDEYLNKYIQIVSELFNRKPRLSSDHCKTQSFNCKWLVEFLDNNFGKLASGKKIPEWVKFLPFEYRKYFILGYLDADGCCNTISKGKDLYVNMSFASINEEVLHSVQDMLFGMGVITSFTKRTDYHTSIIKGHSYLCKPSYVLKANQTQSKIFASYFDNDEHSRKLRTLLNIKPSKNVTSVKCRLSEDNEFIYFKIRSVEKSLYTGTVYNFDCETHTFLCDSIMTHNCDPYDHDDSFTNSLGSTFIYKRFKAGEAWNDVIVAEYSGRPATAEEYYENVRKLLTFYNARLLFENERKGIYPYFTNKHCDYLLADQPDKVISELFKDSKVQRRKGCHMTKQIRQYGEGLILEWLLEEFEPGHPNLERIYSEPLLEELITTNGVKNVDRVIALCMVMIYREELYQVKVAAAKEENKQVELFELPLFSQRYWAEEQVQDDIPIFSF